MLMRVEKHLTERGYIELIWKLEDISMWIKMYTMRFAHY